MNIKGKNPGLIIGSAGAIAGGLLWIIIIGIVLKSALFITMPSVMAVASFLIVFRLYYKFPEKWLLILGSLIIFLVAVNIASANILYQKIPEYVGGISTGKNQMGLIQINVFLAVFAFWGLFCIFAGLFKKKRNQI